MSHHYIVLALAPCLLLGAQPADAATPFNKQVPAHPNSRVQVTNVSGDITITAWDRREVDVQGEFDTGVERIEVEPDAGDVRVRVVLKDRDWRNEHGWRDTQARLQIRVPVEAAIDASTVSGSLIVSGARGEQRLKSVSGDVRSEVTGTDVDASTVSGRVSLTGTGKEDRVRATSVSGDVRLRRMGGDIEARSTSGHVDVDANSPTRIYASVISGNLSVTGTLATKADVQLTAVSGRVKIAAVVPAGARYDVTTFSGNLRNCFGIPSEARDDNSRSWNARSWNDARVMHVERGEGKATVRARSHSGSVEVCDR